MKNVPNYSKIGRCLRLKNSMPFSPTLNRFIDFQYEKLKSYGLNIQFVDYEPNLGTDGKPSLFELSQNLEKFGNLAISTLHCDNNIFGDVETNCKFRAWHDYLHVVHKQPFTLQGEMVVNYHQTRQALFYGLNEFDVQLLNIETAGQVVYYFQHGQFPEDQRKFSIAELYKSFQAPKK